MEVRRAVAADAAAIGRLQVEVWQAAYAGLMDPHVLAAMDPARSGSRWEATLVDPPAGVVVVVGSLSDAPDVVVGFGVGGPSRGEHPATPRELWALNLAVSAQGSGLADVVLAAVVPPGPCQLWVVRGNARAMAFYRRHGFAPDGREQADDRLGVVEERWVRA